MALEEEEGGKLDAAGGQGEVSGAKCVGGGRVQRLFGTVYVGVGS